MHQRGFTLLELVVAIGIFAILWALTFGGWQSVQKVSTETERQAKRLQELETTMSYLTRDLTEAVDRGVRYEYGGRDLMPSMQGGAGASHPLELTRSGWRNPAGQPRSSLQRVAYGVNDEVLVRRAWRVLDRAQDSLPLDAKLLHGVIEMKVRFRDGSGRWVEDWPPPQGSAGRPAALPEAVELTIELDDLGTIGRIFRVPG